MREAGFSSLASVIDGSCTLPYVSSVNFFLFFRFVCDVCGVCMCGVWLCMWYGVCVYNGGAYEYRCRWRPEEGVGSLTRVSCCFDLLSMSAGNLAGSPAERHPSPAPIYGF